MRYVTFLLALALVASCKSAAIPEETTTVAPTRIYGFAKKSDAHLVILGAASLKKGCMIRLSIDGKPAGDIFPAEVAHFGLTIGAHSISARPIDGCVRNCMREARISVKAGDALIMRIDNAGLTPVKL